MSARLTCWIVLGLMSVGICGVGMSQSAASPDPTTEQRWEYKVYKPQAPDEGALASVLNQSGAEGWEVIGIKDGALILKRVKH